MNKKKRPSSVDVAKLAGVSQASVSRAFSPNGSISESKKTKILSAASQLGYVPNEMARALISNYSNCIAVIQPVSNNSQFYSKVLAELLELLGAANQRVVLFDQGAKGVAEVLPLIDQYQVDGVILASANINDKLINKYVTRGIEFAFINRHVPNVYASSVCTDNDRATVELVQHLYDHGYRRFACLTGCKSASTAVDRVVAYKRKIAELGAISSYLHYGEFSVSSGYQQMRNLLMLNIALPEVVVCGNDEIAIGVTNAIKDHSTLRIPEDIAVTGFDDIDSAAWPPYSLTTVRQPIKELCELTVSDLLLRIRDPEASPINAKLQGELVVRQST